MQAPGTSPVACKDPTPEVRRTTFALVNELSKDIMLLKLQLLRESEFATRWQRAMLSTDPVANVRDRVCDIKINESFPPARHN